MSKEQELPESKAANDVQEEAEETLVSEPENEEESAPQESEEAAVEAPETEEISIESLQKELAQVKQQAEQNWDKAVRAQAEMENLRRRTQKDLENAHKFALEKFTKEIITVIDSLELGIQASNGDNPEVVKLREGSELTLKQFEAVFSKFNIEAINPLGKAFNPEHHQAMSMQPSDEYAPNTVMNVFQKGYLLNGRLIRPAMVVVAKAAAPDQKEQ